MFVLWVFLLLIAGSIVTAADSPYTEFLRDHNKKNVIWLDIKSNPKPLIHACEYQQVLRYGWRSAAAALKDEIKSDMECLNCLVQDWTKLTGSDFDAQCSKDSSIPVKRIFGRSRMSDKLEKRSVETSDVSYFRNHGRKPQSGQTTSQAKTVADTVEWSFTLGGKISTKSKVKLPLLAETELSFEVSATGAYKSAKTSTKTITAQSQKVEVAPRSWIKTSWILYKTTRTFKYTVNLEVDYDQQGYNSQRFRQFKRLCDDGRVQMNYGNGKKGVHLGFEGDKVIIYNVPVTEKVTGYTIIHEIGAAKGLNVPIPEGALIKDL